MLDIHRESYSDKSIVVFGDDIKNVHEVMMKLGGIDNERLRSKTRFRGGFGWIFPKWKEGAVDTVIKELITKDAINSQKLNKPPTEEWRDDDTEQIIKRIRDMRAIIVDMEDELLDRKEKTSGVPTDTPDFTMNLAASLKEPLVLHPSQSSRPSITTDTNLSVAPTTKKITGQYSRFTRPS